MKKQFRIKKNEEFQLVFKKGKSMANREFVIYTLPKEDQPYFRIGLSVSKKIGKAVTRNHIKRRIRQFFTEMKDQLLDGRDYVIIARKPTAEMDYHSIKKSLTHVCKKAKLFKQDGQGNHSSSNQRGKLEHYNKGK